MFKMGFKIEIDIDRYSYSCRCMCICEEWMDGDIVICTRFLIVYLDGLEVLIFYK